MTAMSTEDASLTGLWEVDITGYNNGRAAPPTSFTASTPVHTLKAEQTKTKNRGKLRPTYVTRLVATPATPDDRRCAQ